ncbi:MAG: UDP-N-acetylmuramate--L-alanine ligase [Bacteroidetes bacterium]|nr:MAG: UDP-N-acetylmuramate--L-alanine ligase [Bacteroidota bacterium]
MSLKYITSVFFVGVGGIGMSALARYFNISGKNVFGYDQTSTALTDKLIKEGIQITFSDDISSIDSKLLDSGETNKLLVVYTPAISYSNKILSAFDKIEGMLVMKRAEVLEAITKDKFTIAVGGTHGKTTVTSIIAHILKESGKDLSAFVGGILTDYETNYLSSGNSSVMLVEADEYDRSFHKLTPDLAVITSIDHDHMDVYEDFGSMKESFVEFASNIVEGGTLIVQERVSRLFENSSAIVESYSLAQSAKYFADNIRIENDCFVFDFVSEEHKIMDITIGMAGRHNVENAVVAIAVALKQSVDQKEIKKALAQFQGIKRRFEVHIKTSALVYIDDYAHHPKEIDACISAIKELYPDKKITGVFQPHLYSRTKDFAKAFAVSLDALDEVFLLNIYPAREKPIEGVSSNMILDKMHLREKSIVKKDNLIDELLHSDVEVLVTMGAGDIDKMVIPIRETLLRATE